MNLRNIDQAFIFSNQLCEYSTLLWYIHIFNIVLRYGDRTYIQLILIALLFYKNVCYESLTNRTSVCIPVLYLMNLKYWNFKISIYLFNLGKFIYQYKHKLLPDCFECPLLTVLIKFAIIIPRTLNVPYCRTNTRLFSVNYQGPKFFITLNPDIRNSSSIFSFQSKLRSFHFSRYIYIISIFNNWLNPSLIEYLSLPSYHVLFNLAEIYE
jgi:hypothetical protein